MKKYTRKWHGFVEKGKLELYDKVGFIGEVSKYEGEKVTLTIAKLKRFRSLDQNNYYWGCVIEILADYCGYTPEQMHEALKIKFLLVDTGKIPTVRSTADLSTMEFTDYLEEIRRWASIELSVYIPSPNESQENFESQEMEAKKIFNIN